MTSPNGSIFRFTGHLCREFTDHRWILRAKASDAELWFSLICTWIKGWVNNREAGYLRRHRVHYDVTVMTSLTYKLWIGNLSYCDLCLYMFLLILVILNYKISEAISNAFSRLKLNVIVHLYTKYCEIAASFIFSQALIYRIFLIFKQFMSDQRYCTYRADSRLAPSQWVTSLQSNTVSHWLDTNEESTLTCINGWKGKSLGVGYLNWYIPQILIHYQPIFYMHMPIPSTFNNSKLLKKSNNVRHRLW